MVLRKIKSSERVLVLTSLLKEEVDITQEALAPDCQQEDDLNRSEEYLASMSHDIESCMLSPDGIEVAAVIAGYVVHKYKCQQCKTLSLAIDAERDSGEFQYIKELSRGGLIIPTTGMCHVVKSFALLDMCQKEIDNSCLKSTKGQPNPPQAQ